MTRVTSGLECETLAECNYCYPTEVLSEVRDVTAAFLDLHLYVGYYYYPNNDRKKLVCLRGTVPVIYEGTQYNIPVCIWLHETHPQNPPRCLVCPVASMVINSRSSSVNEQGHVLLHCLSNWKSNWSNLSIVLEEMVAAFQRESPLFSTYPVRSRDHRRSDSSDGSLTNTVGNSVHRKFSHPEMSSSSYVNQSAINSASMGMKASPTMAGAGELSSVKRSYTQELLDFGITFGASNVPNNPTNPFITAPNVNTSNPEDIQNLFKSLQLERTVGTYQLDNKDTKDIPHVWRQSQGHEGNLFTPTGLLSDTHRVLVSHLPVGVCPHRMKNKLTIYFQRRQNGGGEVVAVTYPSVQPDQAVITFRHYKDAARVLIEPHRLITVEEQQVVIHLKKFVGRQVAIPEDVQGEKAEVFSIISSLEGSNFSPADVLEAVQACQDVPSALKYLTHDCPICREQMSFSKMITMTHCSCTFCETCFKAYFSSVIKEKSIEHAVCPMCNEPDVRGAGRREESMEYFNLLDTKIRHYLDTQTHELFQSKLRDKALQEMPNFRWCAHCSFGLLHEADRLRMDCPSCRKSTCFKCKNPWAPQHEGLSCEKFKEWQQLNSPEFQNSRLEVLLSRNKIDCPKCKFRFFLSKGGCLHFKCTQCQHEFCGGCSRPFRLGSACDFSAECAAKGLHAHHPRDCLYHLRDWNVSRLHSLLQRYEVSHPFVSRQKDDGGQRGPRGVCAVMEHKEPGSVREEPCGRPASPEFNNYCTLHFKECLVELINQNRLDPVVLLDENELRVELGRWKVPVPEKEPLETEKLYKKRLKQILIEKVPLTGRAVLGVNPAASPTPSPSPTSPMPAGAPWYSMLNPSRAKAEDSQLLLLLND
ncbi:E3 ubiquitin-protein ligase RNF31 [Trichomycterus rosablanca]|uniref:E3 ubiquitin-protein ligase RNF31 n=1 Tax=Trichomycterus rosablanca TaxID=2290929 RepID=UPI002F34F6C5